MNTSLAAIACLLTLAAAAHADDEILKDVPTNTLRLYQRYQSEYKNPNSSDPALVKDLAAAPGGDLCFLDAALQHASDYPRTTAREMVGKLNTQLSFDFAMKRLDAPESYTRVDAVDVISRFHRDEAVTRLLELLAKDDQFVKTAVAGALGGLHDPRIEPVLLETTKDKIPMLADAARASLAALKSKAAFPLLVAYMDSTTDFSHRENAITNIAAYHNKEAVKVLLGEFKRQGDQAEIRAFNLHQWTHYRLRDCLVEAKSLIGPFPDTSADQWEDFWTRAEPLLTDDLKLKNPPVAKVTPNYRDEEFAKNADAITMTATVNAKSFPIGDPIRLDLLLTNTGTQPACIVAPQLYNTWDVGIRLKRGTTLLLDLSPAPAQRQGSQSAGPPQFTTLAPAETRATHTCIQHWLDYRLDTPLAEGEYELTILFDAAKLPNAKAIGTQLLNREEATVRFTVKGEARRDPEEILAAIADITGLKFLRADLYSQNSERYQPAWRAIMDYGDSRLAPLLAPMMASTPSKAFPMTSVDMLLPYERKARPRGDQQ